jgi:hypothetical protein
VAAFSLMLRLSTSTTFAGEYEGRSHQSISDRGHDRGTAPRGYLGVVRTPSLLSPGRFESGSAKNPINKMQRHTNQTDGSHAV